MRIDLHICVHLRTYNSIPSNVFYITRRMKLPVKFYHELQIVLELALKGTSNYK